LMNRAQGDTARAETLKPLTKIVIISRDVQESKKAIEMECHRRGLETPFRKERFSLLHLPMGRFLLLAYQSMESGDFSCDPEMFASVVDSGLLSAQHTERNHMTYMRLVPQYFERCRSETEWDQAFDQLLNGMPYRSADTQATTAALVVDQPKRQELHALYNQFKGLAKLLFTDNCEEVTQHTARLRNYIQQFLKPKLSQSAIPSDQEVVRDIVSTLDELPNEIQVTSTEFQSLLIGYLQDDDQAEVEVSDDYLSLVGPESAEGTQVHHVWVFGAQQATFPRRFDFEWPFNDFTMDTHISRERNFWMAVLRHPKITLTLSLSHLYNEEARIFSPYVNEVANRLGLGLEKLKLNPTSQSASPSMIHMPSTSPSYSLVEIARYRLCPFAYYSVQGDRLAKTSANNFQLSWRAQAWWLEQALDVVVSLGNLRAHINPPHQARHTLKNEFWRICAQVNSSFDQEFPGMAQQGRDDVKQRAMKLFYNVLLKGENRRESDIKRDKYFKSVYTAYVRDRYKLRIDHIPETTHPIGGSSILIPRRYKIISGQYNNKIHMYNIAASFASFGAQPENPNVNPDIHIELSATFQQDHMPNQYKAMLWFMSSVSNIQNAQAEIQSRIAEIERGYFPKNPGEHCIYCPATGSCQSSGERREEHR
jgi:hypothetical protein